jgi:hypothetical protein
MKHATFHSMTFSALSARADAVNTDYTVAELIGGDDLREIIVFLRHEQDDLGEDYGYRLVAKEVIGVALCDVDDPYAMPEILDRDQAWELFGQQFIEDLEGVE